MRPFLLLAGFTLAIAASITPTPASACTCVDAVTQFYCCDCHLVTPCPVMDTTNELKNSLDATSAVATLNSQTTQKNDAQAQQQAMGPSGALSTFTPRLDYTTLASRIAALPAIGKHAAIAGNAVNVDGQMDQTAIATMQTGFAADGIGINPNTSSLLAWFRTKPDPQRFAQLSLRDTYSLALSLLADQTAIRTTITQLSQHADGGNQRSDFQVNTEARLLYVYMQNRFAVLTALLAITDFNQKVLDQ